MLQKSIPNIDKNFGFFTFNWYKICDVCFDRLLIEMNLWKERKSM